MTATTKKIVSPTEYEVKSKEIDRLWNLFSKTGQDLDKVILEARTILENSGYSRTEAIKKIADDHKHLRGLSLPNLYRILPKEDKQYQASKIRIGGEQEKDSHFENDLELQEEESDQKRFGLDNDIRQEEEEDDYKGLDLSNGTNESINVTTAYDLNAETNDGNADDERQQQKGEEGVSIQEYKLLRQQVEEQNKEIQKLSETKKKEESIKKQLPEEVVKIAENVDLSTSKLELLTNSKLRKHPAIQKSLVDTIKDFSLPKAIITVEQKIRDIETGALVKTGKDSYTIDYDKREKIDTRIQVVKTSVEKHLEILDKAYGFMFSLTGHKITKDESEYEPKHIDLSEPYRIEILKGLSEQQKRALFKDLTLLSDAIDSFIDIIENEYDGIKRAE